MTKEVFETYQMVHINDVVRITSAARHNAGEIIKLYDVVISLTKRIERLEREKSPESSNIDNEDVGDEALASMAEITSQLAFKVKADITELFRLVHDISGILVTQQTQIDEIKNKQNEV
jgi:hypothetical protein